MIFGYRRVSTKDQTFNRQDIEGCDRIFEEYISGGQRKRPERKHAPRAAAMQP